MPELPEVETVRIQANRDLTGQVIDKVIVRVKKIIVGEPDSLCGEEISGVFRVGKYLFVHFVSGRGLVIHLKMTGRFVLGDPWYQDAIHTRVIITLRNGEKLYYWDTRMFGYIKVEEDIVQAQKDVQLKLGPEVWDINTSDILARFKRTARAIKNVILDQSILAGIGNIYANDALWMAGIDPRRAANSLTEEDVVQLVDSLKRVLERGLKLGGASDNTFRDFHGKLGNYQKEFLVYGRGGLPCNACGKTLTRIVVGGRGTWVCSACQN